MAAGDEDDEEIAITAAHSQPIHSPFTAHSQAAMAAGDEDDEEIVITSLATETPTTTPSARVAAAVDLGRCRQLDEASCFAADLACCRQLSEVDLAELKGDQGRSREITLSEVDLAELKGDQGRSRELKRAAAAVQRGAPSMSFQGDGEGRAVEDDGGAFEDDGGAAAEEADEAADAYEEASDLRGLGRQSRCLGRQSRWAAAAAARKLSPPHLPCGDTEELEGEEEEEEEVEEASPEDGMDDGVNSQQGVNSQPEDGMDDVVLPAGFDPTASMIDMSTTGCGLMAKMKRRTRAAAKLPAKGSSKPPGPVAKSPTRAAAKTTPAKGVPASAPSAGAMPRVPANSPAANLGRGSPLQSRSLNSSAQDARDSAPGSKKKEKKAKGTKASTSEITSEITSEKKAPKAKGTKASTKASTKSRGAAAAAAAPVLTDAEGDAEGEEGPTTEAAAAARPKGRALRVAQFEVPAAEDFTPRSSRRAPCSRSQRQPLANAPRIAFSSASHADAEVLKAIAQSLGAHVLGDGAAEEATHLVLGSKTGAKGGGATGAKRTLKVLQAILRGAWVLSEQWLFESLDADELLPEAGFETSAFVGARRARERRQAGEPIQPLARTSVAIVEQDAAACERLVGLARLAGATLAPPTRADVVIDAVAHAKASSNGGASARRRGDGALVSAEWLYDSVSDCERKPVGAYQPVEAVA